MRHLLLLLALGQACVIGGNGVPKPSDLTPSWLIESPLVIGIQADPAEIRPGETALFSSLIAQPDGSPERVNVWFACPVEGDGVGLGCEFETSDDASTEDLTDLAAQGFIGVEPGLPPQYTAPVDLLDTLEEDERPEGVYVLAQLTSMLPEQFEDSDAFEPADMLIAYKRLVVSEALTPNLNPQLERFTVDGEEISVDTPASVKPGVLVELAVELPESSIEDYTFLNSDGEVEDRVEEPYVTWYTTGGMMPGNVSLYPYTQADWTSPDEVGATGRWYAVARDRRGGMTWLIRDWVVTRN
jgi:hypothetical protein